MKELPPMSPSMMGIKGEKNRSFVVIINRK
jgi:hypothetical protein